MALNLTNSLIATILSTDDITNNVPINFGTGNPAFDSNVGEYIRYLALGAGANGIILPKVPCTQFYIKNNDAAKTVQVAWTQNGGGNVNVLILNVGAQLLFWDNPVGVTTPGIANLTLTPSAAGCLVEMFLGG